ncbi:MAG: hypothetical protein NVSMB57_15680 [Actinomycetota bacterium]
MLAFQLLEWSFIVLLVGMLGLSGVIGMIVLVRMIEPRGMKVFLQRFSRKPSHR